MPRRHRCRRRQAADLEAAATALSSLSFGLMFVDQLVFGADCARLKRVTHVAAGVRRRFGAEAGCDGQRASARA